MTAPLAEIIRGHQKLGGCCICNENRQLLMCRQVHCASSLHIVCIMRTLWVGPALVFKGHSVQRQVEEKAGERQQAEKGQACLVALTQRKGGRGGAHRGI